MFSGPLLPAEFRTSVMAVPPLARAADAAIDPAGNTAIIRHIEAGGVVTGIRRFVEEAMIPAVVYVKHDGFLKPVDVAALVTDGLVSCIRYATVRDDPAHDPYLREPVDMVDPSLVISGIGEQPAIVHLQDFGLGGFTTGCGCVAPRLSQRLLAAAVAGRWDDAKRLQKVFEPLEDLRNAISPIRVLHEAVTAAGIAATGPLLPLLDVVEESHQPAIVSAARSLRAANCPST